MKYKNVHRVIEEATWLSVLQTIIDETNVVDATNIEIKMKTWRNALPWDWDGVASGDETGWWEV